MGERVRADGPACATCAAKTLSTEGAICEPWKLGPSNNSNRKHRRQVLGRNHTSGTTMRPLLCPHPESQVLTTPTTQVLLRRILKK